MRVAAAGLFAAWAYSAPPLRLAARGVGEIAVAAGWLLVVLGSDYVLRGQPAAAPLAAGLAYGLMVANLLYINQFPDANADACAGKLTIVVRLGRRCGRVVFASMACSAFVVLIVAVNSGHLPYPTLLAAAAMLPAGSAAYQLWQHGERPQRLLPAIRQTILAVHLYGFLLVIGLLFRR